MDRLWGRWQSRETNGAGKSICPWCVNLPMSAFLIVIAAIMTALTAAGIVGKNTRPNSIERLPPLPVKQPHLSLNPSAAPRWVQSYRRRDIFKVWRKCARKNGVLIIADEVMTGMGRAGRNFAADHWGIAPDILVTAKGLSSGYAPLGAVIGDQ